jgi:hypothetical protein
MDALFVGGIDYPAEQAGVISIPVPGPYETKREIEAIVAGRRRLSVSDSAQLNRLDWSSVMR